MLPICCYNMCVYPAELPPPPDSDQEQVRGAAAGPALLCTRKRNIALQQRISIKIEERAKVVAPAWGRAVSVNLFAALVILHQDDVKNRMNCTRMIIFFKSS